MHISRLAEAAMPPSLPSICFLQEMRKGFMLPAPTLACKVKDSAACKFGPAAAFSTER